MWPRAAGKEAARRKSPSPETRPSQPVRPLKNRFPFAATDIKISARLYLEMLNHANLVERNHRVRRWREVKRGEREESSKSSQTLQVQRPQGDASIHSRGCFHSFKGMHSFIQGDAFIHSRGCFHSFKRMHPFILLRWQGWERCLEKCRLVRKTLIHKLDPKP